jgi:hypothetical protein
MGGGGVNSGLNPGLGAGKSKIEDWLLDPIPYGWISVGKTSLRGFAYFITR